MFDDKPFSANAWTYRPRVLWSWRQDLDLLLALCGGKAVGLKLCDEMSSTDTRIRVPPWRSIESGRRLVDQETMLWLAWMTRMHSKMMVRSSSGLGEDWETPDAGRDISLRCESDGVKGLLRQKADMGLLPVVVQGFVEGVGLVVDFLWSHFLNAPVARVACGRKLQKHFTSPTWDHEAPVQVYFLDGRSHRLNEPTLLDGIIPDLLEALLRGLNRLEITFGVQLELIIHPNDPEIWNLVQLRPSPDVRRLPDGWEGVSSRGILLTETLRISRAGTAQGRAVHRRCYPGVCAPPT